MDYWEDDDYDDDEDEEPQQVETFVLDKQGACCVCGKPGCTNGCYSCGKPVCYNEQDYWASSTCGGWILDTWHPEHPEGNEFYCSNCLKEE